MTYEEALKRARDIAVHFKQGVDEDGEHWIEVKGVRYKREKFFRNMARIWTYGVEG